MTGPIVAPYVPFYASPQPYLTVAEFQATPSGVDLSSLVPGGTPPEQDAALATVIREASGYADVIAHQVLAATVDMQSGRYRINREGSIRVPVDYSPVIEVVAMSAGSRPQQLTAAVLSGVWIDKKVLTIPACGYGAGPGGQLYAQITYVNGYANTLLAADAAAGDAAITVTSAVGVLAGMPLTVQDDLSSSTEQVTVAAGYVPGSTTVPLVAALAADHEAGTAVTALPSPVKRAVKFLVAHIIKTRGAESISFATVNGGPGQLGKAEVGSSEEYDEAVRLLAPFTRTR